VAAPAVFVLTESPALMAPWLDFLRRLRVRHPACFIVVLVAAPDRHGDYAALRLSCFAHGAQMFSSEAELASVERALQLVQAQMGQGALACPYCPLSNLTEDELWRHCPLYHIQERNDKLITCPVCLETCNPSHNRPFQVHLRNLHGPCGRGELASEDDHRPDELYAFALVVCVRNGRMLLVHEFASLGLWLPGGQVDRGERLGAAAVRETKEEAGLDVELTGVLKVHYAPHASPRSSRGYVRLRVVFFAQPLHDGDPKSLPDYESAGGVWADLRDIVADKFPLRGDEPKMWAQYLLDGGKIHDISIVRLSLARVARRRRQRAMYFCSFRAGNNDGFTRRWASRRSSGASCACARSRPQPC